MTSRGPRWSKALALGTMLGASVVATNTAAQPPRGAPGGQHSQGSLLQQRLGLTDEQMNSIQEVYRREAQGATQTRQALRRAESELRELVLGGADDAKIQAKTGEVKTLLGATVDARIKTLREIVAMLTPEQREEFARLNEPVQGEMRPPRERPDAGPR